MLKVEGQFIPFVLDHPVVLQLVTSPECMLHSTSGGKVTFDQRDGNVEGVIREVAGLNLAACSAVNYLSVIAKFHSVLWNLYMM